MPAPRLSDPLRALLLAVVTATLLDGCTAKQRTGTDPIPQGGRVFTSAQIARWGLADAYEVMERAGGYTADESPTRGNVRVRQRRGQVSLANPNADRPLILMDNTMMADARMLRQVRVQQLDRVVILSSAEATARYGTGGGSGAILVFTRMR